MIESDSYFLHIFASNLYKKPETLGYRDKQYHLLACGAGEAASGNSDLSYFCFVPVIFHTLSM